METPLHHSADQQPVTVNDREQLIYLLTEAAEIEHGLMCSYLYAAWSLKQSTKEDVTTEHLRTIDRWRNEIHAVAMEEMLHLALVSNLLMSLGAAPHFMRPNFPLPPGYHPCSIVVRLTPLNRATVDHFVYLERPEGVSLPQADGFETKVYYERQNWLQRLTPTAQDYDTVGHLYNGIASGFEHLARSIGEEHVFIGDRNAQMDHRVLPLDGLIAVTNLQSALAAVAVIVEQGEGARRDAESSHYSRFCTIRDEYDGFLRTDPGFTPHRDAVSDPVMFPPILQQGQVHIDASVSARVLDAANAAYGLMLRLLASAFSMASGSSAARRIEVDCAITMMSVVKSLGVLLTTLPARQGCEHAKAGMNFHLPRTALALPQHAAGAVILAERAREIARSVCALSSELPWLDSGPGRRLADVAEKLQEAAAKSGA